jgi:D-alanyl-D-alanine carboxypeptidase
MCFAAAPPKGDPLAALGELAASVKAAGINRVNDVMIDDRLFTPHEYADGLVTPIWVNENLLDVDVTPGSVAKDAVSVDVRPQTVAYTVDVKATASSPTESTDLHVVEPTPGHPVGTGTIAAGSAPQLLVHDITDPSAFARTAFIEAPQRAGVTRTAAATGPNPAGLLPAPVAMQRPTSSASTSRRSWPIS